MKFDDEINSPVDYTVADFYMNYSFDIENPVICCPFKGCSWRRDVCFCRLELIVGFAEDHLRDHITIEDENG